MTNEEIEKRFLFDLEMNMFNKIEIYSMRDNEYRYVVAFTEQRLNHTKNIEKIIKFLEKNGYILDEINSYDFKYMDETKRAIVIIDVDRKTFMRDMNSYETYSGLISLSYNYIPDYIRVYRLWQMKRLKKDSYLI